MDLLVNINSDSVTPWGLWVWHIQAIAQVDRLSRVFLGGD